MSDVALPTVPLDVLAREIVACVQRVFRDQEKADGWRVTARQKLNEAYRRTGGGAAFAAFLEPVCKQIEVVQDDSGVPRSISVSYAYEIMGKTDEEIRADWRDRNHARDDRNVAARKSVSHGKTGNPTKNQKKKKTQPQLLAAFRKCVDAMTPETRREATAYLKGQ